MTTVPTGLYPCSACGGYGAHLAGCIYAPTPVFVPTYTFTLPSWQCGGCKTWYPSTHQECRCQSIQPKRDDAQSS